MPRFELSLHIQGRTEVREMSQMIEPNVQRARPVFGIGVNFGQTAVREYFLNSPGWNVFWNPAAWGYDLRQTRETARTATIETEGRTAMRNNAKGSFVSRQNTSTDLYIPARRSFPRVFQLRRQMTTPALIEVYFVHNRVTWNQANSIHLVKINHPRSSTMKFAKWCVHISCLLSICSVAIAQERPGVVTNPSFEIADDKSSTKLLGWRTGGDGPLIQIDESVKNTRIPNCRK